jgi:EAL domain-containing protein (putative c-di-GMP-specific phosphodiesterase class I)
MGPAEFIPLLERSGLILQLGEWVQREACRQCRQWLDEGRTPGVIAINLSPVEIQEGRVHDQLQAILTQTGLPAQHIELEVTESGLLAYGSQAAAFLQRLHDLGVRLAIDDFGTGYSSLAYLKRFPVHKLKIDRTFVRDLPDDPVDSQLTSTIISLARSLDLKVLAEGVETEAQRQLLSEQGCDYWQGYLASRPLPAAEFAARFLSPAGAAST